ncbi:MAG: hypothetical protein K0S37_3840 [Microbacterium sp.]|jgi:hypothetical protein|nr:hypothetical protein [Microbacterium sp.]
MHTLGLLAMATRMAKNVHAAIATMDRFFDDDFFVALCALTTAVAGTSGPLVFVHTVEPWGTLMFIVDAVLLVRWHVKWERAFFSLLSREDEERP